MVIFHFFLFAEKKTWNEEKNSINIIETRRRFRLKRHEVSGWTESTWAEVWLHSELAVGIKLFKYDTARLCNQ